MMKKHFICLLPALALLFASSLAGRADQFTQIQNSPYTYWVPAPTPPPPGYVAGPPPYYYGPYGPPPGYYGPPPSPPPVVIIPHFFIGFHFH
jgi:hypothetical protein